MLVDPPCDCELDEVQQVLSPLAHRAGSVAVASAAQTPEEVKRFPHRLICVKLNQKHENKENVT